MYLVGSVGARRQTSADYDRAMERFRQSQQWIKSLEMRPIPRFDLAPARILFVDDARFGHRAFL